ncbi:MAG TPA: LysM domain-containing protein, partial [Bacteroidales bacterium]|nr:LysM domain-containing protein [Bacteroidales bacterium]
MNCFLADAGGYVHTCTLYRKITGVILMLSLFLLSPLKTSGQVVVEKSKDKVIISGTQYYIHVVRKGETAYSISRAYGITVDELVRNNPGSGNGLRTGQALRIPVVETPAAGQEQDKKKLTPDKQRDESKFFYHRLKPGET